MGTVIALRRATTDAIPWRGVITPHMRLSFRVGMEYGHANAAPPTAHLSPVYLRRGYDLGKRLRLTPIVVWTRRPGLLRRLWSAL